MKFVLVRNAVGPAPGAGAAGSWGNSPGRSDE